MPTRKTYPSVVIAAIIVALTLVASAQAKDRWPLHPGSSGTRVANLQWLLCGAKPNRYDKIKGTLPCQMQRGLWGKRTTHALAAYRYRFGVPAPYWRDRTVGPRFVNMLLGKEPRPADWAILATKRLQAVEPGATNLALKIKAVELSQIGVSETWGTNYGPQIRLYQLVTGQLRAAWCMSFQAWSFLHGGYGYFANRSANVFYAVDWMARRSYLHARPKIGALALFLDRQGHVGYVVKVLASGYVTVEGNASNRVLERFHPHGSRRVTFGYLPGVA